MSFLKMRYLKPAVFLLCIFIYTSASAQFYVTGDNPAKLKWNSICSENYHIIYPKGSDSLAVEYARKLETFRIPVSRTTGYLPGGTGKYRMPVVMHAFNTSNGSVAWAPKRMDLFTLPTPYDPDPMPWSTMLSVHESRHVTQMQFAMTKALKPGNWIFGEMFNILMSLIYPGLSNMEGDAVVTETALTKSGRGRTADFLNYYHVAFDNGDFRNWDRWRFMSQKHYAPDHYALGYITVGGFRYLYDCPQYMNESYHLAARRPYNLAAFYTTARKMTGKKFNDAFSEVCDTLSRMWKKEADQRAPYIYSEPVTKEPRLYTDYRNSILSGDDIYSVKRGHLNSPVLVRIDTQGNERFISHFSPSTSGLKYDPELQRIYWSETMTNGRWSMKSESKIRYYNLRNRTKKTVRGTKGFVNNPEPVADTKNIATVRYDENGKTFLTFINTVNGKTVKEIQAPDGIQLVETAVIGDEIYCSAVSEEGFGILCMNNGQWIEILKPEPVKIKDFMAHGEQLMFTCDRTGVNELYHLDPKNGKLLQKTSTRYGASDFAYSQDGSYLYYSSQTMKGMRIFRTPSDSLLNRETDFTEHHKWAIADKLAAQEKEIAHDDGYDAAVSYDKDIEISDPKRYRKFPHAFNVHSWAPFYVNVDNIMNMSFDYTWQAISLGAAGIMQNRLSTAVGEFGYSAHKDPYDPARWRHSGHARFTYSGWYPVIEASVDFNDRASRQWNMYAYRNEGNVRFIQLNTKGTEKSYLTGKLAVYIPFSFSGNGWYHGFIPRVAYTISNDRFNSRIAVFDLETDKETGETYGTYAGSTKGKNLPMQTVSASIRGYSMLGTANSAVYPRLGIGAELGSHLNVESLEYLTPMGYIYVYGYIPGILRSHGIRLSLTRQFVLQKDFLFASPVTDVLPRGFRGSMDILSHLTMSSFSTTKLTADYAAPVYIGDLDIAGSFFSIKRLVLSPHFDLTLSRDIRYGKQRMLFSAGCSLALDLHSILWLEWPCSLGVTWSFNGGPSLNSLENDTGVKVGRHYVGPVFNVTF